MEWLGLTRLPPNLRHLRAVDVSPEADGNFSKPLAVHANSAVKKRVAARIAAQLQSLLGKDGVISDLHKPLLLYKILEHLCDASFGAKHA